MDTNIVGQTLTNVIVVIETIFKYLSARQLNTCARVCKVWRDQARREKESRQRLYWNCFIYNGPDRETLDETWWKSVTLYITESPVQPKCLLVFCTDTLCSLLVSPSSQGRKRRKTNSETSKIFTPYLPNDCTFHIIVTDGIVGTDSSLKTVELEDYEHDTALSLMIFGENAGVEFVSFSLPHSDCLKMAKYWSEGNSQAPSCMQCLANEEVKMINLYCPMSGIDQEIGYSFFRMFNWPLIAGGYVNEKMLKDSLGVIHSSDKNSIVSGLALCGADVKVASVLIHNEATTENEVDSIVHKLTEQDFPLHKSFGLMYACVGRGIHAYAKHNVESSMFRKYFPKTPLLGFFGNGEIGCNYPPADPLFIGDVDKMNLSSGSPGSLSASSDNDDNGIGELKLSRAQMKRQMAEMRQKQDAYKMKHPPKLLHAYTTVMCLISLP